MSTDLKRDNSGHTANGLWQRGIRFRICAKELDTKKSRIHSAYRFIMLYHTASYSSKMGYLMVDMHHPTTVSFIYCQPSVVRYGFADRIPACQRRATEQIGMQE